MRSDSQRAVELRLRAAVESAPSGLLMIDADGRIILVNREIERLFGYSREELLGKPVDLLVPQRFRAQHPRYRAGFYADPRVRAMGAGRDLFGLRKDGTEVPVEIGLTPVPTEEGFFVLSSIVDISARKRAEEARLQLEAQLRHAQKLEAVGTLAGGVAHDFNNILGAVVGYAEFLVMTANDEQTQADLRELLKAADRGRNLVQQILLFSRRQDIVRRPVELGETVAEAAKLFRATLPPSITLRVTIHPDAPRVLADPTSIHQVVMNLASNAAHAMPGGGTLEIAVEPLYVRDSVARLRPDLREGPYAVIAVRDTGLGMDRAVRERAFEPFFTTKGPGSGTGLGLAIVHGIIRDHAGAIELESEPGRGTAVKCLLPAIIGGDEDRLAREDDVLLGRGERILFVEDEKSLATVGERRLTSLGYRPTVVTDVGRALELFREAPEEFDLVITDYSMPRMTGLEFAKALVTARPGIRILMITGFVDDLPPEALREAGVHRVLRKPVTIGELAAAIRDVVQSPAAAPQVRP